MDEPKVVAWATTSLGPVLSLQVGAFFLRKCNSQEKIFAMKYFYVIFSTRLPFFILVLTPCIPSMITHIDMNETPKVFLLATTRFNFLECLVG